MDILINIATVIFAVAVVAAISRSHAASKNNEMWLNIEMVREIIRENLVKSGEQDALYRIYLQGDKHIYERLLAFKLPDGGKDWNAAAESLIRDGREMSAMATIYAAEKRERASRSDRKAE